jgi:hypothetical protein
MPISQSQQANGSGRSCEEVRVVVDRAEGGGYDYITAAEVKVHLQEAGEPVAEEVRATRQ